MKENKNDISAIIGKLKRRKVVPEEENDEKNG